MQVVCAAVIAEPSPSLAHCLLCRNPSPRLEPSHVRPGNPYFTELFVELAAPDAADDLDVGVVTISLLAESKHEHDRDLLLSRSEEEDPLPSELRSPHAREIDRSAASERGGSGKGKVFVGDDFVQELLERTPGSIVRRVGPCLGVDTGLVDLLRGVLRGFELQGHVSRVPRERLGQGRGRPRRWALGCAEGRFHRLRRA